MVDRPLDILRQIQQEVSESAIEPERKVRFLAALDAYGKDSSFDISFGESELVRATLRSLVRYIVGLDPTYTLKGPRLSRDYFAIINRVLNPVSAWNETDRRMVSLYMEPAFSKPLFGEDTKNDAEIWREQFLTQVKYFATVEPHVEVLDLALAVSAPFGVDLTYARERFFTVFGTGLLEDGKVTSLGRHAVEWFRQDPVAVLAESAAVHCSCELIQTILLRDRVLFDHHVGIVREAMLAGGFSPGLLTSLIECDAQAYAALVKEAIAACTVNEHMCQYRFAQSLRTHYPQEQALFKRCALASLGLSIWDREGGGFGERCLWIAGFFPEEVLDPDGPISIEYPHLRIEAMKAFLPVFRERALPLAVRCLMTMPRSQGAREHAAYVSDILDSVTDYDLSPYRPQLERFFSGDDIDRRVRVEAMARIDRKPVVYPEQTPVGPPINGCYALDRYGDLLDRSWLADCLACRVDIPQPVTQVTARRRDLEFEICALIFEDDARSRREITVGITCPTLVPEHLDDVDVDSPGFRSHLYQLLRRLLKRFRIPATAETIDELGWEGLLGALRTYEIWRAVRHLGVELRRQGIRFSEVWRGVSANGDGDQEIHLRLAEQAVRDALTFLNGRPLFAQEFAGLVYEDRVRQAWLLELIGNGPVTR